MEAIGDIDVAENHKKHYLQLTIIMAVLMYITFMGQVIKLKYLEKSSQRKPIFKTTKCCCSTGLGTTF